MVMKIYQKKNALKIGVLYIGLNETIGVKSKTIMSKFDDLMYEAGLTAQGCLDDYDQAALQRFAESIVRECAGVCAGIAAVRAGYNDVDGRDTAYSCGDTIKEYFGVE